MNDWNPILYEKFLKERTLPAKDLLSKIDIASPQKIIDIGCGPGNSTKVLFDKFPNAKIIGIDNSKKMIEQAKHNFSKIEFINADISTDEINYENEFDIVFSNACMQWIPNHHVLLKKLMNMLKQNGILAVQIPINFSEPIHKLIQKVTTSDKWKNKFSVKREMYNLSQNEYCDILAELSSDFLMWETTYYHVMPSHSSLLDWYKGTGLSPYLNQLSELDANIFLQEIFEGLTEIYPKQKNGQILFKFPRLFFVAKK